MPTYDYECSACKHAFEEFQSITAAPLKKCPKCGKSTLQRLIGTGGGVIFKGSGFYQTDYRSESYKKAAESESKPKETTDKKAASSGDKSTSEASKAPATTDPVKPSTSDAKESKPAKAKGSKKAGA